MHLSLLATGLILISGCAEKPSAVTETNIPSESVAVAATTNVAAVVQDDSDKAKDSKPAGKVESKDEPVAKKDEVPAKEPAANKVAASEIDESDSEATEVAAENAEELEKSAKSEFKELTAAYGEKRKAWISKMREAEDRESLMKEDPAIELASECAELAKKYPTTEVRAEILKKAIVSGKGDGRTEAMNEMLAFVKSSKDKLAAPVTQAIRTLVRSGSGEPLDEAAKMMLKTAKKDLESKESFASLKTVATIRETTPVKDQAFDLLLKLADKDIRSKRAASALSLVFSNAEGDHVESAMERLMEHHSDSAEIIKVMSGLSRSVPSAANEKLLKQLAKSSNGKVRGHALVSLAKFLDNRDMYREYFSSADEEDRKSLGEEALAYIDADVDESESADLEAALNLFVKDHQPLVESAEGQLFVMRNLQVGKTAPDITANDLAGVEFSLSDYRGKIVFLDFWGDW
jgi:hypothetical protein